MLYLCSPVSSKLLCSFLFSIMTGGKRQCIPVEFTPLYYGAPVDADEGCDKKLKSILVEPHGFSTKVSSEFANSLKNGDTVLLDQPNEVITIHESSGVSSGYLAQTKGVKMSQTEYKSANFPVFECFGSGEARMVDGGSTDNTGILALLRRNCKSVIACLASNLSVNDPASEDANVTALGTLAGLFGRQKSTGLVDLVDNEWYNRTRQVFPSQRWDELLDVWRKKLKAGLPTVHKMTLPVLENTLVGVKGGYDATILFVVSGECSKWQARLPAAIKAKIQADKISGEGVLVEAGIRPANLSHFPYMPVGDLYYSPELLTLMAQLHSFQMLESSDDLKSIFE